LASIIALVISTIYGFLLVIAALSAWLILMLLSNKKTQIPSGDVSLAYLVGISGGIAGAYLLRPIMKVFEIIIFRERFFFASSGEFLDYLFGEIVFYGGFIGGLIAVVLFCRKFKIKLIPLFDISAPALSFAHAVGRIGCFFGGCCYGIKMPEGHLLSVIYPSISLSAPPYVQYI